MKLSLRILLLLALCTVLALSVASCGHFKDTDDSVVDDDSHKKKGRGGDDDGGDGGGAGGATNHSPIANAGPDQNVSTGFMVTLDGSGSSDTDGDALTYAWSFISKPGGSTASLSDSTLENPTFTADLDGAYVLNLVVNDVRVNSAADLVTVTAATASAVTLASGLSSPHGITVDSGSVYWTECVPNTGAVKKVPINGGAITTLASGQYQSVHVAVDATSVYWTNYNTIGTPCCTPFYGNAVGKAGTGGGAVNYLVTGGTLTTNNIAIDSDTVYWAESRGGIYGLGNIVSISKNGGTSTLLASGQSCVTGLAVDATGVYWEESHNCGGGADQTTIGEIKKTGLTGGAITTLATGLKNSEGGIAIDAIYVYWTDYGNGKVMKIKKDGSGSSVALASGLSNPQSLAIDTTSVYWKEGGNLKRVSKEGGTVYTLASGVDNQGFIAVDDLNVYWTEYSSGKVKKLSKQAVSQGTYVLQPGPEGKDTCFGTVYYTGGIPDSDKLHYGGWGDAYYDFLEFALDASPSADCTTKAEFHIYNEGLRPNDPQIQILRITSPWTENGVTSSNVPSSVFYKNMGTLVSGWNIVDITDLYTDWKSSVYPNYGIRLSPGYTWESNGAFISSDNADSSIRPKLVVTWSGNGCP